MQNNQLMVRVKKYNNKAKVRVTKTKELNTKLRRGKYKAKIGQVKEIRNRYTRMSTRKSQTQVQKH